ncbi:cobalamin biosynthesis protein [Methanohalobium evestigatum]|uniref:cobalamin biosynthesis protein n=1 Tax=Methanohalobium evestigatum TaxID=2322 RepID=UPI001E4A99DC|nr:cobalamin biosynthesis protein [Methanohalobium evestigatum]
MTLVIGIGTRKDVTTQEVIDAVSKALNESGYNLDDISFMASAKMKENETGLLDAANIMDIKIQFIPHDILNQHKSPTKSQASRFGLDGVAEPSAIALSEKKELLLRKRKYGRVTIAIAE